MSCGLGNMPRKQGWMRVLWTTAAGGRASIGVVSSSWTLYIVASWSEKGSWASVKTTWVLGRSTPMRKQVLLSLAPKSWVTGICRGAMITCPFLVLESTTLKLLGMEEGGRCGIDGDFSRVCVTDYGCGYG